MSYFNLDEGFDIYNKESNTAKQLRVIDNKYTVFLTEYHFNAHYSKRIPMINEILGTNLSKETFIKYGLDIIKKQYKNMLKECKLIESKYPTIKGSSAVIPHVPIILNVEGTVYTLDIGVFCTCEQLFSIRVPRVSAEEGHKYYVENCENPEVLNAIKRGNLTQRSPMFFIKSVVIDLKEGDCRPVYSGGIEGSMVILKQPDVEIIKLDITKETYKELKKHVKSTKKL